MNSAQLAAPHLPHAGSRRTDGNRRPGRRLPHALHARTRDCARLSQRQQHLRRGDASAHLQFTLLPTGENLGDTYADALTKDSDFQRIIADLDRADSRSRSGAIPTASTPIECSANISTSGFTVAGRPLPEGQPISGSPYGTKSDGPVRQFATCSDDESVGQIIQMSGNERGQVENLS